MRKYPEARDSTASSCANAREPERLARLNVATTPSGQCWHVEHKQPSRDGWRSTSTRFDKSKSIDASVYTGPPLRASRVAARSRTCRYPDARRCSGRADGRRPSGSGLVGGQRAVVACSSSKVVALGSPTLSPPTAKPCGLSAAAARAAWRRQIGEHAALDQREERLVLARGHGGCPPPPRQRALQSRFSSPSGWPRQPRTRPVG